MNEKTEQRTCPICGISYLAAPGRLKHGRQTTCARKCSYILRNQQRDTKTSLTCALCGSEVKRSAAHIKGKHGSIFCSRTCHYSGRTSGLTKRVVARPYVVTEAGRAAWKVGGQKTAQIRRARDNYRKSEEMRAKMSEATARALAEGRLKVTSKIEDVVARELDTLGISYTRQKFFRNTATGQFCAVCDFFLTDFATVLEVNGTYWHADPRTYPDGTLNTMQVGCVAKYRRKLEYLKSINIPVIEVWEMDLKRDPAQAVAIACANLTAR